MSGDTRVAEPITDFSGRPCLYREEVEHRRGIVNGIIVHVRLENASIDLDSPPHLLWPAVARAMPGIKLLLLGTEHYLEWIGGVSPPEEGTGFQRFEILTFQTMMEGLEGFVQAEHDADAEAWAASGDKWIRSLSYFQAGSRWLVGMADRC